MPRCVWVIHAIVIWRLVDFNTNCCSKNIRAGLRNIYNFEFEYTNTELHFQQKVNLLCHKQVDLINLLAALIWNLLFIISVKHKTKMKKLAQFYKFYSKIKNEVRKLSNFLKSQFSTTKIFEARAWFAIRLCRNRHVKRRRS